MQRTRNCLTGLSQRFNLYFVSYQDKIYVYQPQQPPQILPDESLILRPRRSAVAKKVGGYKNRAFGHQVNHLKVGDLGDLEVLFFCYDDGDVMAYYTHQIARYVSEHGTNPHLGVPKQFFHSNVGKSAWGLAIHKQSRLLAVTCNKHEVTVFAFSITDYQDGYNPAEPDETEDSPGWARPLRTEELEKHFQSRTRTWHIILSVGHNGHNMPDVAFCDDGAGNAEKVVAVDLGGNIWIIDIWKLRSSPTVVMGVKPGFMHVNSMGWGVLILSDSDFKPTDSYCEAFGLPKAQIIKDASPPRGGEYPWWDITCSLYYLRDSAPDQYDQLRAFFSFPYYDYHIRTLPVHLRNPDGEARWVYPGQKVGGIESVKQIAAAEGTAEQFVGPADAHRSDAGTHGSDESSDTGPQSWVLFTNYERKEKVNFSRIIAPASGHLSRDDLSPEKLKSVLDEDQFRGAQTTVKSFRDAHVPRYHTNMSIFFTDQHAVELYPLDFQSSPGVVCRNVLSSYHQSPHAPWDLHRDISEHISMLHHVRELNLVVCGSANGRVALVTLTKARRYHADMPFRRGFRVDVVLPRRSDEARRTWPRAPLHGMAVSPVQDHKARGLDLHRPERDGRPAPTGQVYRRMRYFRDHSI